MKAKAIALILTSTLALTGLAACGNAGAAGDKPADNAPAQEQVKPAETQDKAQDAKAEAKDAKAEAKDAKAEAKDAKADEKQDAAKDAKSADQKPAAEAPANK